MKRDNAYPLVEAKATPVNVTTKVTIRHHISPYTGIVSEPDMKIESARVIDRHVDVDR